MWNSSVAEALFYAAVRVGLGDERDGATYIAAEWPWSGVGGGVLLGKVQSAEGDADVEVAEDELDATRLLAAASSG
jgi:hypothetical protein